ncbi:hypothetical protein GQ53DRAFT_721636 [Thozetella sp. PMI_491]|nr:hypothetical protein GQ53DRAFT_721636 [Thozetella sp. PMI_491]
MASSAQIDEESAPDERALLLEQPARRRGSPSSNSPEPQVPKHIAYRLYTSHFLSTWNSRVFEFGAVLYLAAIFPGTLLPMSLYAFGRGLSAIIFAPAVGRYIDIGNRLQVVRVSIVSQRLAAALSCVIFYLLSTDHRFEGQWKAAALVLLTLLACIEKLASITNSVSVERDWVVVVAREDRAAMKTLNAQMRRIDLLCKLFGPLFIALIDTASTSAAVVVNFALNVSSVAVEYYAIARVYYDVPSLQRPKDQAQEERDDGPSELSNGLDGWLHRSWRYIRAITTKHAGDFSLYFHHRVFIPSFALALLYLTVLGFGGQMLTYLLSVGYNSAQVSAARTASVFFELLSTWVAPWLMDRIGPLRAGLWLSNWQVAMLTAGVAVFWAFSKSSAMISAGGLVIGMALSRVGLRGFELCAQLILQEEVEEANRGSFSSVEAAWQNIFELASYMVTIVFFRPDDFKWPATISAVAVACASWIYAFFVYRRRGHLLHLEILIPFLGVKGKARERERALERITSSNDV